MAQLKAHETRSSSLCFDSHLPLFKTLYADIVLKSQTLQILEAIPALKKIIFNCRIFLTLAWCAPSFHMQVISLKEIT